MHRASYGNGRSAALVAALLALVGCDVGVGAGSGLKAQYFSARDALDDGQYDRARREYLLLIEEAGPLAPRIELEYAHGELRAGRFDEAARIAAGLAARQAGEARGAALAVQGTAQHELGIRALADGDTATGVAALQSGRPALAEVLDHASAVDPLGAMAGRLAAIDARLARL